MGLRLDHRVQEAINRGALGVEIDIWPQHTTGRVRNYQQLFSSIPSLSKEDVMLVQNGRKIDHWVESQGEVWGKLPELGSEHQTIIALVGQRGAPNLSNGDDVFLLFDDFPGSSINSDKWTEHVAFGCSVSVSNGELNAYHGGGSNDYTEIKSVSSFGQTRIRYRAKQSNAGNNSGLYTFVGLSTDTVLDFKLDSDALSIVDFVSSNASLYGINAVGISSDRTYTALSPNTNVSTSYRTFQITRKTASMLYECISESSSIEISTDFWSDDASLFLGVTGNDSPANTIIHYVDWIAVTRTVDVEPIIGVRRTLSRSQLETAVRAQI